jgi:hypothetical protein
VITDVQGSKRANVSGGDYRAFIKGQPQIFSCEGGDGLDGFALDETAFYIGFRCCAAVR